MNVIDFCIIVVVIIFCIRGFLKGLVHELFTLGIIILGLTASLLFFRPLGLALQKSLGNRDLSFILAFFIIFAGIAIFFIILRNALIGLIDRVNLTDIDYVLGIVIGMVEGVLLCSIILIFLENHPVLGIDRMVASSLLHPHIKGIFLFLSGLLPESIRLPFYRVLGVV
jgi:membrane protein required for colicin V production